jgi:hypothetical protein
LALPPDCATVRAAELVVAADKTRWLMRLTMPTATLSALLGLTDKPLFSMPPVTKRDAIDKQRWKELIPDKCGVPRDMVIDLLDINTEECVIGYSREGTSKELKKELIQACGSATNHDMRSA